MIWTEDDIYAGLYIIKESSPFGSDNLSFARSVTYKIGFSYNPNDKKYGLISCLTDGFYSAIADNRKEIADYLNNDVTGWGYRRLTKEEYLKLIESTEQGFAKTY
jgi:hypothetical protein